MATLADMLRGWSDKVINLPTEAQRFMVSPTSFIDALTGKQALPTETGFAQGATGTPQQQNLTVLDPNNRAYMEGYDIGEPFSYAAIASPLVASGATKLSNKAVQAITKNPNATAMGVMDYASGFSPTSQIFIGPSAKNWNTDAAFKAAQMEKAGKSAEEIWQATGTARGLDNHWRQEIPDVNVSVLSYGTEKELSKYPEMRNVLGHKELYDNYGNVLASRPVGPDQAPFTKDYYGNPQVGGASFNQRTLEYTVSPRPEGATGSEYAKAQKSGLLHELQHGIQKEENWAKGGHQKLFTQQKDAELARDILSFRNEINSERFKGLTDQQKQEAIIKEYKNSGASDWLPSQETMNLAFDIKGNPSEELKALINLYGLNKSTSALSPEKMYNNLAGEAESRLTQNRIDLTAEQRKQNFPFKEGKKSYGLDINPEDAIILNETGDVMTRKELLQKLINSAK
jgi:hypothetical protein